MTAPRTAAQRYSEPLARMWGDPLAYPAFGKSWLPTVVPPEYVAMAVVFTDQFNLGYGVGTKLPGPDDNPADYEKVTIDGFIRVEGIGCTPANELEFDADWALHCYHPKPQVANQLCLQLMAFAANAQGNSVTVTFDDGSQDNWFVTGSRVVVGAQPQEDPTVDLPRTRCLVSWRIPGHQLEGQ